MEGSTMKKVLFTLILIIMSTMVAADWNTSNYDQTRASSNLKDTGDFNDFSLFVLKDSGNEFQPIVTDVDNDEIPEIITGDGSKLVVMYFNGANIITEDEITLAGTQDSTFTIVDADNDSYLDIAAVFGGTFYIIEHNGTDTLILQSNSTIPTITSGVACLNKACYFTTDDGNITEYNVSDNTFVQYSYSADNIFNNFYGTRQSPILIDIDRSGDLDLIVARNYSNGVGEEGAGVCVWDTVTRTALTTFSTDGCSDYDTNIQAMSGIAAGNLDGAGDPEVVITAARLSGTGGTFKVMSVYDSVGNQDWSLTMGDTQQDEEVSNPILATETGTYGAINFIIKDTMYVGDALDKNVYPFKKAQANSQQYTRGRMIGGGRIDASSADSIFEWTEITTGGTMFISGINGTLNVTPSAVTYATFGAYPVDASGNNVPDIIGYNDTHIYLSVSVSVNAPPSIVGAYGSNPSYLSPICVNNTLTIKAQDINITGTGNYYNDISSDTEALVTDCGLSAFGVNETTGNFSDSTPFHACEYNVTGTYTMRVYLIDNANIADRTQFRDIAVNVINGETGVTCNIGAIAPTPDASIPSTVAVQDEAINELVDGLTGANPTYKMIIGFLILMAIIVYAAKMGMTSPFVLGIITIISLIMLTFLTFLPVYIMALVLISLILVLVFKNFVSSGGGESNGPI